MNILQIANKAIFPPDGGTLAILSLTKGYIQNGYTVHIVNMTTHKHQNNLKIIEPKYNDKLKVTGVETNIRISVFRLLLNLFLSKKPYNAQRFYTKKFEKELINTIQRTKYDFIQIEGLYVLQYIHVLRKHFSGKIIYRPHNVEFMIWQRNATETKTLFKKTYFNILYQRLKKLELSLLNTYDFIIPISKKDSELYQNLGNIKPSFVIPFGIDIQEHFIPVKNNDFNINYIGALDWIPNQDGLIWFIEKCFPNILDSIPDAKLHIAGRNAPSWFIKKLNHPNIHFYGEVESAPDFINNPGPMIVPLFSGSGMRVKIIESMALRKAIVATSIAAEGINYTHEKDILIANTIESFSENVINLLNNVNLQSQLADNAFNLVKEQYNFKTISNTVLNFINK